MNKIYWLTTLLFLFAFTNGVAAQTTASIFFETDRSELSPEACQILDALAPTLLQAPDYQVNIEAFADDRGTEKYNQQLAADRAAAVQNYLATKGLVAEKAAVSNWGERKAIGTSDLDRQQSRRVDVAVKAFYFDDVFALQDRLSANTEQVLKIRAGEEQSVTAAQGTLIIVPANAFVFSNGTTPTGPIDLLIREAYDPSDFIRHNLTTTSNGRVLQTGGMVCITARADGRELQLAEGASLTVSMPDGGSFDPEMELFYAEPMAAGGVDWKPAGQKFRKTLRPSRVEITVDAALGKRIAAIKVPEYPKPAMPAYKGKMSPEPKMPVAPFKPRAPKKPEWESVQKMFAGGGDVTRLSRKELKKAQQYFSEQAVRYTRDSARYIQLAARYQQNLEGYAKNKIRFEQDHQNWESELRTRLEAIAWYKRDMKVHFYSKALAKAVKVKAKTIQAYETYSNLYGSVEVLAYEQTQLLMAGGGFSDNTRQSVREVGNVYESIIGLQVMDNYKPYQNLVWSVANSLPSDTTSRVMQRMLEKTGLRVLSDSLKSEIHEKTLLTSKSTEQLNRAMRGYVASVSQLGWINCDRFYNSPAERIQVLVNEKEDATLYAVCKDINAILPFYRNVAGDYVAGDLPKGQKITLVAIKMKDGMPLFSRRDMKVGEPVPALSYEAMPLRDLKEALKKLNG